MKSKRCCSPGGKMGEIVQKKKKKKAGKKWLARTSLSCFTMSHVFCGISPHESRGATVLNVCFQADLQENKEPLTLMKKYYFTVILQNLRSQVVGLLRSVCFNLLTLLSVPEKKIVPEFSASLHHLTANSLLKITLKNTKPSHCLKGLFKYMFHILYGSIT